MIDYIQKHYSFLSIMFDSIEQVYHLEKIVFIDAVVSDTGNHDNFRLFIKSSNTHKQKYDFTSYHLKRVTMGRHLFTADYTCFRTTFMTKSNAFV